MMLIKVPRYMVSCTHITSGRTVFVVVPDLLNFFYKQRHGYETLNL